MVYTANWVIIYHLPPIKGTRNSYWRIEGHTQKSPRLSSEFGTGILGPKNLSLNSEAFMYRYTYSYHTHIIHGAGIFTYFYHKNQLNVGRYTSPMDAMDTLGVFGNGNNTYGFLGRFRLNPTSWCLRWTELLLLVSMGTSLQWCVGNVLQHGMLFSEKFRVFDHLGGGNSHILGHFHPWGRWIANLKVASFFKMGWFNKTNSETFKWVGFPPPNLCSNKKTSLTLNMTKNVGRRTEPRSMGVTWY